MVELLCVYPCVPWRRVSSERGQRPLTIFSSLFTFGRDHTGTRTCSGISWTPVFHSGATSRLLEGRVLRCIPRRASMAPVEDLARFSVAGTPLRLKRIPRGLKRTEVWKGRVSLIFITFVPSPQHCHPDSGLHFIHPGPQFRHTPNSPRLIQPYKSFSDLLCLVQCRNAK